MKPLILLACLFIAGCNSSGDSASFAAPVSLFSNWRLTYAPAWTDGYLEIDELGSIVYGAESGGHFLQDQCICDLTIVSETELDVTNCQSVGSMACNFGGAQVFSITGQTLTLCRKTAATCTGATVDTCQLPLNCFEYEVE